MRAECAAVDITGVRAEVTRMARLLGVSTSGYYGHVKAKRATTLTERQQRREDLTVKIVALHKDSGGTYGSPRITADLRELGDRVSENTVAAIMAEIGLTGISPRTFKVATTIVDPTASFPPDLVNRMFDQGRLDAVWTTDITYLTCGEGDMYFCAIKDEHSKKVLGWLVADHMRTEMVLDTVNRAVEARDGRCEGTILHSDRGGQYTAEEMEKVCRRNGLRRSMGETGICWDNAGAESLWSTFKHEFYYRHTYATESELVAAVDKWVHFYNTTRRHSAIGMLSPVNYEKSLTVAAKAA
jgi:putative transposase